MILCYFGKEFGWNDFSCVVGEEFISEVNCFLIDDCWNKDEVRKIFRMG